MKIDKDTKIFSQYGQIGYGEEMYHERCEDGHYSYNEIKAEYDKRIEKYKRDGLIEGVHYEAYFDEEWLDKYGNDYNYQFDEHLCEISGYEVEDHEDEVPRNECINCIDKYQEGECFVCHVNIGAGENVELAKHSTWSWEVSACNNDQGKFSPKDIVITSEIKVETLRGLLETNMNVNVTDELLLKFINYLDGVLIEKVSDLIDEELLYSVTDGKENWIEVKE